MNIRCMLAVSAARMIGFISRRLGFQGMTWAGQAALWICPDLISCLAGQLREKIFAVCGTNGKTTTNNLLCAALEAEGRKVVCNHTGSNMKNGVAAALVLAAGADGRLDADYACLEVDEASARLIFPALQPDFIILTNLFRDQLDRYGEIDMTMEILEQAVREVPKAKLILNGDDPLSVSLAEETSFPFAAFGIREQVNRMPPDEMREGRYCRRCGHLLSYRFYHFSQLGAYECPYCGFKRPVPAYEAGEINMEDGLSFTVEDRRFHTGSRGLYHVYNILAAYAGLREAGLEAEHFARMLSDFHPGNGRSEQFTIHGAKVTLNLAKNPTGFNQNLDDVLQDRTPKDLMILINDHDQDGNDISWLWDVNFDLLQDPSVQSVSVGGTRGLDMRLRLKYADIPSDLIEDGQQDIVRRAENGTGNLYILVNYTALYRTRDILQKLEVSDG